LLLRRTVFPYGEFLLAPSRGIRLNQNHQELKMNVCFLGKTSMILFNGLAVSILLALVLRGSAVSTADDARIVATLDTEYQSAVQKNDAAAMDRILADDFVLVTGTGKVFSKTDLLNEAKAATRIYQVQQDTDQTVRLWRDTAVITAKLSSRGTENGKPFDYSLWFSDTYVRTPAGWRYVFGQASLRLPAAP
jgi:ketosteroid isomerase-like protein